MAQLNGTPQYANATAVTPADGTSQRYLAFMCAVGGTITVRPEAGAADVQLTLVAGFLYPLAVTAIRATGTAATGIVGLN